MLLKYQGINDYIHNTFDDTTLSIIFFFLDVPVA